jgi:hypothetical protein
VPLFAIREPHSSDVALQDPALPVDQAAHETNSVSSLPPPSTQSIFDSESQLVSQPERGDGVLAVELPRVEVDSQEIRIAQDPLVEYGTQLAMEKPPTPRYQMDQRTPAILLDRKPLVSEDVASSLADRRAFFDALDAQEFVPEMPEVERRHMAKRKRGQEKKSEEEEFRPVLELPDVNEKAAKAARVSVSPHARTKGTSNKHLKLWTLSYAIIQRFSNSCKASPRSRRNRVNKLLLKLTASALFCSN